MSIIKALNNAMVGVPDFSKVKTKGTVTPRPSSTSSGKGGSRYTVRAVPSGGSVRYYVTSPDGKSERSFGTKARAEQVLSQSNRALDTAAQYNTDRGQTTPAVREEVSEPRPSRVTRQVVAKPTPPPENPAPLAGLKDRESVATGSSQASSGAAQAVSQAAAAARSTGGVGSGSGNFKGVGAGSGNFNTNVGGRGVTASIRNREGISTDVGPQFQLEQLQVNQDLQGRAAAQSTAAHGIRADLPGRVAAQRLTEGRGQTRGRASTILTSGGARGLGGTPANTLGARRLVSGRTPATPVEGTQAGEAAAAQAGVQQRQGIRAEQDRQALRNTAQTSDTRSAGAQQTSRREALIGGTGGEISGGAGGGQSVSPRNLSARQQRTQALNAELDEQRRVAEAGRQAERVSTLLGGAPGNEATRARARRAGQGAASRSRQGGRPPQRGNVPERVRARRTLLGGG